MSEQSSTRRDFLAKASAALVIVSAPGSQTPVPAQDQAVSKFQPEELWRERMRPPGDGKRYGWFIDSRRCFGCHACEVSCKEENDVPLGHFIRQTIYKDVGEFPKVARLFLPMSCQHCEDAPCIKACPCGALHKDAGGTVAIDYNLCCGHGVCVEVCPYGAVYLDPVAKQAVKCHNCYHRLEHAMEPACVPTCPSGALYFGDLDDPDSKVARAKKEFEDQGGETTQLRPEKNTKPRMWFAGRAATENEERVPREGDSYSPDAYSVHQWKERNDG